MHKKYIENFAKNLKQRRKQLGYTQEQICEKLNISYSHYVKLENGINAPSFETLITISNTLNVSIDSLIFKSCDALTVFDLANKISDYDKHKLETIQNFINFLLDTKNIKQ